MNKKLAASLSGFAFLLASTFSTETLKASAAQITNTMCLVFNNPNYACLAVSATPTPTPTATPVPTPVPSSAATATPTPVPTATAVAYTHCNPPFSAPNNYPDSCFQPYAHGSTNVWNNAVAQAAPVDSNSTTWMNYYTAHYTFFNDLEFGYSNQSNQYQHPIYFGNSTDPLWTFHCTNSYGDCSGSWRVPTYFQAAGGTDGHSTIIDQTTNKELDLYGGATVNQSTHVITADNGDQTNFLTGDGLGGEQTHSGFRLWAGVIRAQELIQGQINHALIVIAPCTSSTNIYPSLTYLTTSDYQCTSNQGAPYGQWMRLNMTASAISAQSWPTYIKTIAYAASSYGMYIGDTTTATRFALQFEADPMYSAAGYTNSQCPSNGAPCTPLTAYFNQYYPSLWNGSRYVVNLSQYLGTSNWQFIDNPPGHS